MTDRQMSLLFWLAFGFFMIFLTFGNLYFIQIQRWCAGHFDFGCGPGYHAVYHGIHQEITCALKP
jgi:hypothetical protein